MKILLSHRFFWPDTAPYALMLRSIGDSLADHGHQVHIFSSKPSYRDGPDAPYRETLGKLNVRRIWVLKENRKQPILRILNVAIYCIALFFRIIYLKPQVVTASTFPPVLAAWFASLASKLIGAKFVYHLQDIHPEVSKFSGGRMGRGLIAKIMTWLDNQSLKRAYKIVTLSEDMAQTLRDRNIGSLPIQIINNLPLEDNSKVMAPPPDYVKTPGTIRVIFAGNLGRFQNLSVLAEGVATRFKKYPNLELLFLGDGAMLQELKDKWGDHPQVNFAPFMPFAQARELIQEADVGLMSLAPDIYRVAYPSKVITYKNLGVPILALIEKHSNLAKDLEAQGDGVVPHSASPEDIGKALDKTICLFKDAEELLNSHCRNQNFSILDKWCELLEASKPERSLSY